MSTATSLTNLQPTAFLPAYSNTTPFGNFLRPFDVNSLWNSRPIDPVFSPYVIPEDYAFPSVGPGQFSTGVFEALPTDTSMIVYPLPGKSGVWEPDGEMRYPVVMVPRWPAATKPSESGDGHADIVDLVTGIVHSFWKLQRIGDLWCAEQYAWSRINGAGWGDPAHYYQGARATGVPPIGGLIRKHEIDDGKDLYNHALSLSLTFSGLSPDPTYVAPATSADTYAATLNRGGVPEGALLMLPPGFNINRITTPKLRKVAKTLMRYGAYVVDQCTGAPFYVYVENDSGYSLHGESGWDAVAGAELHILRENLRMVTGAASWVNGYGKPRTDVLPKNLLSMRGDWRLGSTKGPCEYNTFSQALVFAPSATVVTVTNGSGRAISKVTWAAPQEGDTLKITARATNGAKLRIVIWSGAGPTSVKTFDSDYLADGESATFTIPTTWWYTLYARNGVGDATSTVSGEMIKV